MKNQIHLKASVLVLVSIVFLFWSCQENDDLNYQIVEMNGSVEFVNYTTSGVAYVLKTDSASATAMLAAKGDLIMIEDDYFFHDGSSSYEFTISDKVVYNSGKIFSFSLSNESFVEMLKQNSDAVDLSQLDHIVIDENLPEDVLVLIRIIASQNKEIGLVVKNWSQEIVPILEALNVKWLSLDQCSNENLNALKSISNVEYLMLTDPASQFETELVDFPSLEGLVIDDYGFRDAVATSFLSNNKKIKQLAIVNSEITEFDFLSGLDDLKSLTLQVSNSVDLAFVSDYENLTRLGVISDDTKNWNEIGQVEAIEWLLISANIDQNEFDELMRSLPKISILEMLQCDSIESVESLMALDELKALTISDTVRDLEAILKLKDLAFLSLPQSNLEDAAYAQKIEKALPNTVVVPNDGFCMGSGWILLMLPMIIIGVLLRRTYLNKQAS